MEYGTLRRRMIEMQLRRRGIDDERVLLAMEQVPREEFIPPAYRRRAYEDRAIPLALEQTVSQPYTVAMMCQTLQLEPDDVVLEIGTGSGYGAAVLSCLARHVHTIERLPELADAARTLLQQLGYDNTTVHEGDGTLGLPEAAPFDAICVTAGGDQLPPAYPQQLAEGGRLLIPLTQPGGHQTMTLFTRRDGQLHRQDLGTFRFVPLVGAEAPWRR